MFASTSSSSYYLRESPKTVVVVVVGTVVVGVVVVVVVAILLRVNKYFVLDTSKKCENVNGCTYDASYSDASKNEPGI